MKSYTYIKQIWIFNPHTIITSNYHPKPLHTTKVYYQFINPSSKSQSIQTIDKYKDLEVVYLPKSVYLEFQKTLKEKNEQLPISLREWSGEWKSAWLERF